MNRTSGPLAVWFLERNDQPAMDYDEPVLTQVATLTTEAARILRAHQLLVPERLVLTGWVEPGDGAAKADRFTMPFSSLEGLADDVLTQTRRRGELPTRLELSGTTLIFDAAGRGSMVPGAIELVGYAFTEVAAELSTYVDVWLPYDLRATPQPDVHDRNAPRLAAALNDMAALAGVEISDLGPTKYALIGGVNLDNHRDLQGAAVPVLDDET